MVYKVTLIMFIYNYFLIAYKKHEWCFLLVFFSD
jgi:hypothetical protein